MTLTIPTIDIDSVNISVNRNSLQDDTLLAVGQELVRALFDVGFLYIINHGVPNEDIQATYNSGLRFFDLPLETKLHFLRNRRKGECGYVPDHEIAPSEHSGDVDQVVIERFNLNKPLDVKEVFDICHNCESWPDKEVPNLQVARTLIHHSQQLIRRLLLLVSYGLNLEDRDVFLSGFKGFETKENTSQLRLLRYPAVSEEKLQANQDRCGEHTDYGCMTLVYMDTTPGLQVYTRQGFYIDIEPLPGAILVNIGDLMQRWSGDQLRSAKHRVIFRPDTFDKVRHSMVYFAHTDDKVVIKPVTGNLNMYPSVVTHNHMNRRFIDTFELGKGLDEELTADY